MGLFNRVVSPVIVSRRRPLPMTLISQFHFGRRGLEAECVAAVVQGTLTSRAPKYSIILDLDRKVRDMELPKYAQGPPPEGAGLSETMSHFMPTNYRELSWVVFLYTSAGWALKCCF